MFTDRRKVAARRAAETRQFARRQGGVSALAAIMNGMGIELAGVTVQADEWSEECSTAIENVSGYVVVVSSVLRSRAVTLISSYLANLSGTTAVSHLRACPTTPPVFSQRILR